MKKELNRLIIKGGVLSPGELKTIAVAAENAGLKSISFGSRQDILFSKQITEENLSNFNAMEWIAPDESGSENIVCSYVSADIFPKTPWLTGDRYLYILEQFRHHPTLKINIVDPKQRLVPLFTGHLNFVASNHEDYWFLNIRLPHWEKVVSYPALIYSWDIAKVSLAIENVLQEEPETVEMIFDLVNDAIDTNNRTIDTPLHVPFHPFPYYEGMNKMGTDKYWLGLYWRNNKYDLSFLKDMCDLCAECKIGKICITPWKSFIIKGIQSEFKLKWEKFLGKRGINVRHSLLELNWHLPVANKEALKLKKYLVSNFDQNDISTYGLTFGITYYTKKAYYFTSIVVEKNKQPKIPGNFTIRDTYNLLYAKNFDPNTLEYITHVQDIDKVELPGLLMELSKMYFEQLGEEQSSPKEETTEIKKEMISEAHQCQDCLTIYDAKYGDHTQAIPPNTAFEKLPENYTCSMCDAPKTNFKKIKLEKQIG
ncbi:rubredoxin [Galbibacter mesophilus]|uniref:rubredoxin n=1 Tax=Galbibacter mesophilus TaxID=379069 RepID=UPI00191D68D7|nr:rubredoxin [Galbibacter mesophilus]MCM5663685.1 rubredoxin [Galbibacter mesophilus]